MSAMKRVGKKKMQKIAIVAEQLHFANTLGGNDPIKRNRAMKKLRQYFQARLSDGFRFSYDDFLRIWKGLFYCMWMSDKPLVQEELSEEISQLVHSLSIEATQALEFIRAFFSTLIIEWYGIDQHRMDKFLMFVRRFLRQTLFYCKKKKWEQSVVDGLSRVFGGTVLCIKECEKASFDVSLTIHFIDIFLEELAKVGVDSLCSETLLCFLEPFVIHLKSQHDKRIQHCIRDKIFYALIQQSPQGLEYEEKFEAWKRAGFPGSSWKEMQFVGKEDKRSGVFLKHLDPRAGNVNVYLPRIQFDAKEVANLIRKFANNSGSKIYMDKIADKFDMLAEDEYPLAEHIPKAVRQKNKYRFSKKMIDEATENLLQFEKELERECKKFEGNPKRKRDAKVNDSNTSKKMKLDKKKIKEKENCEQIGTEVHSTHFDKILPSHAKNNIVRKKLKKKKNIMEWNVEEIDPNSLKVKSTSLPHAGDDESDDTGISTIEKWNEKQDSPTVQTGHKIREDRTQNGFLEENITTDEDNITANEPELNKSCKDEVAMSGEKMNCESENNEDSNEALNGSSESYLPEKEVNTLLESDSAINNKVETLSKSATSSSPETPTRRVIRKGIRRSLRSTEQLTLGIQNLKPDESQTSVIESEIANLDSSGKTSQISDVSGNDEEESLSPTVETPTINAKRASLRGKRNKNTQLATENIGLEETEEENVDLLNSSVLQKSPLSSALSPTKRRLSLRSVTPGKKVNIVLQMNRSQAMSEYVAAVRQSPSVPHDANKKPCKGVLKRTSISSPINPFYRPPKGMKKI